MQFFRYFPTVDYTFTNGSDFRMKITDITTHIKIVSRLKDHVTAFYDYVIQDGERPDTVAQKLYGSADYLWVLFLVNDFMSLYDWPLTDAEFNAYITDRYGSVQAAQAETMYRTVDGHLVDDLTYATLTGDQQGVPFSRYDYELELNEAKRRIKVVPAGLVRALAIELRNMMA